MGLTPDQIATLLAGSRTKGQYVSRLNEFLNSNTDGVAVAEEWPMDFGPSAEKKPATVKQGFENAKNSKNAANGSDHVRVILNADQVYLIREQAPVATESTESDEVAA